MNKILTNKQELEDSKSHTNKSAKNSQSESNLEKFKSLEKSSKISHKISSSKNNSMSLKSKVSKNITEDRYKMEADADAEAVDDILNEIERSENSKMKMSEKEKSQKSGSRVESFKNGEENNERFVVTNKEVDEE